MVPHPNATGFALVRSNLAGSVYGLPRQTFDVPKLFPLPRSGVLVDTPLWDSVLLLGPVGPFRDGQLDATRVSVGGQGGRVQGGHLRRSAASSQRIAQAGRYRAPLL